MAIQVENSLECAGLFDGRTTPAAGTPIVTAAGILPWDPDSHNVFEPVGGFTNNTDSAFPLIRTGFYAVGAVNSFDGLEVCCLATTVSDGAGAGPGAGRPSPVIGALVVKDGFVQVMDNESDGVEDAFLNFSFYLAVFRIKYAASFTPT